MPYYDPAALAQGRGDLAALSTDTHSVLVYGDAHLASLGRRDGGWIFKHFLSGHSESVAKFEELVVGTSKLLGNASTHLQGTMEEYAKGEQANLDVIKDLWVALEMSEGLEPVGPPPIGGVSPGPLPSTVLDIPASNTGHWIFDVLSWPTYLSISGWARRILELIFQGFTGKNPWNWLWEWMGGDFDQIDVVSDAWRNLSRYFDALPEELVVRVQNMFHGWYDSDAATASGEYFAEVSKALGSVEGPLQSLATLYHNVAWSSYGFFQAIYSLLDAAVDAIIASLMGGVTVLEAVAAFFSGGATAIPAAATAVIAAIEAVASAWNWMMTTVYGVVALAALLGAATTDVNWVTLPEG